MSESGSNAPDSSNLGVHADERMPPVFALLKWSKDLIVNCRLNALPFDRKSKLSVLSRTFAATVLFRWLVPSLPSEAKDVVLPHVHVGRE